MRLPAADCGAISGSAKASREMEKMKFVNRILMSQPCRSLGGADRALQLPLSSRTLASIGPEVWSVVAARIMMQPFFMSDLV
jgi:hypothetical protein